VIPKKKESNTESQNFACPNPSCGKVFSNPIKAENVSLKNAKPYDACPYCLTEINLATISAVGEEEPNQEAKPIKVERETSSVNEQKLEKTSPKAKDCARHFGYLSERSSKEKIPEDCMICENIVQCMLKAVTG
jgi:hypothetical protein